MEVDEPIREKNSILFPNRLYYKDLRTGNSINYKTLRHVHNPSHHFVHKELLHDPSINLKEARQLFNTRFRELDDGDLEADGEQYYLPFLYSVDKRGRWLIQNDVRMVCKAKWLKEEDYSLSYNERHIENITKPNVKLHCNRDGTIKRSKTLSREKDLIAANRPESDEDCPISINYSFYSPAPVTSSLKCKNLEEKSCKFTQTRMRKRRNCFIGGEILSTNSARDIFGTSDEVDYEELTELDKAEKNKRANPYSVTISDFLVNQQNNKKVKNRKHFKKRKELRWRSLEESRFDEEEKIKNEELETSLENNSNNDKREEITFKFILPAKCYKSFLIECSERNIYVLDAETNPQMFLLDFTYKIRNTCLENGFDANDIKKSRFLLLTTFLNDNDSIVMKMVLYMNINLNSALLSFENFSESFTDAINEVNYHIFSWLRSYLPLRKLNEKIESNNGKISERVSLKSVYEQIFGSQMSMDYEHIWLTSLRNYWEENRPNIEDFDNNLLTVKDWCIQCDICMEQYNVSDGLSLKCRHWFCLNCWIEYLSIFNFNCSLCPMVNCKVEVTLPTYLAILSFDKFSRLEKNIIDKTIRNEAWVYCNNPKCQKLTKTKDVFSSTAYCSCSEKWCKLCGLDAHWPSSCNQYRYFLEFQQMLKVPKQIQFKNLFVIIPVKSCPFCGIMIEKLDGCNHISCICEKYFCWICLSPWEKCTRGCRNREKEAKVVVFTDEKCIKTLQFRQAVRKEKPYSKLKTIYSTVERYMTQMNIPLNDSMKENIGETFINSNNLCKISNSLLRNYAIYTGTLIREDIPSEILRKLSHLEELLNRAETLQMKLHNLIKVNNRIVFRKSWLENVITARESLDKLLKEIVFFTKDLQEKMQIYK